MKRFLYLFQVEQDLPPALDEVAGPDSDVVFLSWKARSDDPRSVYYPSSSWTQGRNRLLKEVQDRDYLYLIFADDDVRLEPARRTVRGNSPDGDPWREFEAFLLEYEPAIGCASYDWHLTGGALDLDRDCQTLRFFDAVLNAFHKEAVTTLLPYYDLLDESSETYSQNLLCSLAADLYPGHVMQTNRLHVINQEARREYGEFLLSKPEHLYLDALRDPERKRRFLRQPIAGAARHPTMGPPRPKRRSYAVPEEELAQLYRLDHSLWVRRRELRDLPPDDDFFSADPDSSRARRWRENRPPRPEPPLPPRFPRLRNNPVMRLARSTVRSPMLRSNLMVRLGISLVRARGPAPLVELLRRARGHMRARALWRAWSRRPDLVYDIPERRQAEVYQLLVAALNRTRGERIVFVDVGACRGDALDLVYRGGVTKPLFSIGIDPIDTRGHRRYAGYVVAAITDGPEGSADFLRYAQSDCSSLKRMIPDVVTQDPSEAGMRQYYSVADIARLEEIVSVPTFRLSTIIEQYGLDGEILHFVKIDAQGSDLDVFRSLGEGADRCLFLQMETLLPAEDGSTTTLYEGQSTFPEDRAAIEACGFRLFNVARFGVTPEADVTFVNTRLFKELLPELAD